MGSPIVRLHTPSTSCFVDGARRQVFAPGWNSIVFVHTAVLAGMPQGAVILHVIGPGVSLRGGDRMTSTHSTRRIGGSRFL